MERLTHDIFLLMIYLAQLKDEATIRRVFLDAMNSSLPDLRLRFLAAGDPSTEYTVDVVAHGEGFGRVAVEGATGGLEANRYTIITNAISMLAIVLENRRQAQLLADENVRLESAVAARTAEIAANEKLLRTRYESIPAGIVVQDTAGQIVYANNTAREILGLAEDRLLGMQSSHPLWRSVWEDGSTAPGDEHPSMVALRTGEPVRDCLMGIYADDPGKLRWLLINAEPIVDPVTGAMREVMVTFLDVTDRKRAESSLRESEERYRSLFRETLNGFALHEIICDEDGNPVDYRWLDVNPAFERLTGLLAKDVVGRTVNEVLTDEADEWVQRYGRVALTGESIHFESYSAGLDKYFVINAFCPSPGRFAVVFADITDSKRAEQALRDVEAQKRQFYHETILSVTGGRLDICDEPRVQEFTSESELCVTVTSSLEVRQARNDVEAFCRANGLDGDRLHAFMTGVGEAANNAIKHGIQGVVSAGVTEGGVWVGISDQGTGMESLILPHAVLASGFSTKVSLGLGYSIMLEVSDRVYLSTGKQGTTVVLTKELVEPRPRVSLDQLPDTWDSIPG